jgi:tetratricopeptide (TPR) repeat protein
MATKGRFEPSVHRGDRHVMSAESQLPSPDSAGGLRLPEKAPELRLALQEAFDGSNGALALRLIDSLLDDNAADFTALLIQRADALRLLHRLHEAEEILKKVLKKDHSNAEAHFVRARCQFDSGHMAKGRDSIKLALHADPTHAKALRLESH